MTTPDPAEFCAEWLESWNTHDLDRVLSHVAEHVVVTSSFAAQAMPGSDGVVVGKAAVREYWAKALELMPDFRVAIESVFVGVDSVMIAHRNQTGARSSEFIRFDGGLMVEGHTARLQPGTT